MAKEQNLPAKNHSSLVKSFMEINKQGFKDALPQSIPLETFLRIAMTTLRNNPKLMAGNRTSLAGALMQSAQLGLVPDGFLGQAYLVPYKGEIDLQLGYRGLITLARRSGEIKSITARAVYQNDHFLYKDGIEEVLEWTPAEGPRGELRLCYCIARFKDGGHQIDVMFKDEIEKVRAASPSGTSPNSPWVKWPGEMGKKAVLKRASKLWPVSIDVQKMISDDTRVEIGEMTDITAFQEEKEDNEPDAADLLQTANEKKDEKPALPPVAKPAPKKTATNPSGPRRRLCVKCGQKFSKEDARETDIRGEYICKGCDPMCKTVPIQDAEIVEPAPKEGVKPSRACNFCDDSEAVTAVNSWGMGEEAEAYICEKCAKDSGQQCDGCGRPLFAAAVLDPAAPLTMIDEEWLCKECLDKEKTKQ